MLSCGIRTGHKALEMKEQSREERPGRSASVDRREKGRDQNSKKNDNPTENKKDRKKKDKEDIKKDQDLRI